MDYNSKFYANNIFKNAKKCKSIGHICGINRILYEVATHRDITTNNKKQYITTLIKKYGATDLNAAVRFVREFEIIHYLCELGADNYSQIYQHKNYDNSIKTIVYLINKGVDYIDIDLNLRLYITGGAGRIIDNDPKWLHHTVAKPYITHRANILVMLREYLLDGIVGIIDTYLPYEKPPISDEEMKSLNRQFNI